MERQTEMLSELRALNALLQTDTNATAAHKLQTRIILMNAEGDDLATHYIEDVLRLQARDTMGYRIGDCARQTAERTSHRWREWEKRAREIIDETVKMCHPLLTADALTARMVAYLSRLLFVPENGVGRARLAMAASLGPSSRPHG